MGFFPAMLFGIIFPLGWTPCVGAFLGSALMLASQQGHVIKGMLMLLCYSLGLGIPFLLSAILIDYLKSAFNRIKKHYRIINTVSGCFLILVGSHLHACLHPAPLQCSVRLRVSQPILISFASAPFLAK